VTRTVEHRTRCTSASAAVESFSTDHELLPEALFQLLLIGRHGVDSGKAQDPVTGVEQKRRHRLELGSQSRDRVGRDRSVAVTERIAPSASAVRRSSRFASERRRKSPSGRAAARSYRTICCLIECGPPPRIRVFGHTSQRGDVGGSVAGPAGEALLLPEFKDKHRRLPADPLGMAVDEPIEDIVPEHYEPAAREGGDQRNQPLTGNGRFQRNRLLCKVFKRRGL
jgi:hypothetical protein